MGLFLTDFLTRLILCSAFDVHSFSHDMRSTALHATGRSQECISSGFAESYEDIGSCTHGRDASFLQRSLEVFPARHPPGIDLHAEDWPKKIAPPVPVPRKIPQTLFLHFSGCGGTSVISWAKAVEKHSPIGLVLPKEEDSTPNCNVGCGAPPEWAAFGASFGTDHREAHDRCSCHNLRQTAEDLDVNFFGNENVVMAPLNCPGVQYWVALRHPVERLLSRVSKKLKFLSYTNAKDALNRTMVFEYVRHHHEFTGTAALNNWMVRSLLGPAGYKLPLGAVSLQHFNEAKHQLMKFDVIVPLANMSLMPAMVSRHLGTCIQVPVPEAVRGMHSGSTPETQQQKAKFMADKDLMRAIWKHNALDVRLYETSIELFNQRFSRGHDPCEV